MRGAIDDDSESTPRMPIAAYSNDPLHWIRFQMTKSRLSVQNMHTYDVALPLILRNRNFKPPLFPPCIQPVLVSLLVTHVLKHPYIHLSSCTLKSKPREEGFRAIRQRSSSCLPLPIDITSPRRIHSHRTCRPSCSVGSFSQGSYA